MAVTVDATGTELTIASASPAESAPPINTAERSSDGTDVREMHHGAARGQPLFCVRSSLIAGLVMIAIMGGLVGWLAYRHHETQGDMRLRERIVHVGRQVALDLTTIDHTTVDRDVTRILDSTTGEFHADFQKRSASFIDVVKKSESKSVGTVAESGLESFRGNEAQVLLAVQVKTSTKAAPEQPPVAWRMRIYVQKIGEDLKVFDVRFVS